ncbi:MAG: 2-C-methyl-D-erythritol 4-phosphate cytidylyltransferase [Candidatus Omnitrophica bacterium]|nr:2-C-methyl-D-erythritol 4-phosphate cytidylyltransferase [Candidatus Omnitrophota bacterium]MBU1366926.1 2-C-methyl-D-erythritol 4-phosphate cytidylyltransferase [Candidatus Omnitrophota bacterium]MBU1523172.1 2-C-methyl-D-erythritol 4-phosphate cytidylyltransferase [Candidatus Omnitrophota bacterium]MBU1810201.1 2-C-methyl-D-erythritol 4-phosphate cytidylyltransferase [Candidatus Omnitrophota bacterium]MBU2436077.1 2-C-methyl-D-erythritol 4-phosphate cytidylyltransferase [Candidatus Omnitro
MAFRAGVVIVCAGGGKRLGRIDKAVLRLKDKPLFYHAFRIFQEIKEIKQIVLVLRKNHIKLAKKLIPESEFLPLRQIITSGGKNKRVLVVEGGQKRRDSVYNGLSALGTDVNYAIIHDGARPFADREVVLRILKELRNHPAVTCGIKSCDTLKLVDKGFIKQTLPRKDIFLIQTPQGFKKTLILEAHKKFGDRRVFDDAQLIELMGKRVKVVEGDIRNIKITYPKDILLARAIADSI